MQPLGYIVMQHRERLSRPTKAYEKWAERIPTVYREQFHPSQSSTADSTGVDPARLARMKHYSSLMPMAQEARKPVFQLTSADGAIGAHASAVAATKSDFMALAQAILTRIELPL
jgi:hypothetical protein